MEMDSTIIDPRTGKPMAQICLVGEPVPADRMTSTNGRLQGFIILSDQENLWRAWVEQYRVLMHTDGAQSVVRIVTYPTVEDKQGYLDIISIVNADNQSAVQPKARRSR